MNIEKLPINRNMGLRGGFFFIVVGDVGRVVHSACFGGGGWKMVTMEGS